jgi:hypothetical protein
MFSPNRMEIAHVTSAALDENAKAGRHVVKIIPVDLTGAEQKEIALGTLELGRTGQVDVCIFWRLSVVDECRVGKGVFNTSWGCIMGGGGW